MAKLLVSSGAESDLTQGKPVKELLMAWLQTNWDNSGAVTNLPTSDKIIWGKWWTGTGGLHIAFNETITMPERRTLGLMPSLIAYTSRIVIDMFSRGLNGYPPDLAAASWFITQLITTNGDGLASSGIANMSVFRGMEQREEDPASTVFHYAIDVTLIYSKAAIET